MATHAPASSHPALPPHKIALGLWRYARFVSTPERLDDIIAMADGLHDTDAARHTAQEAKADPRLAQAFEDKNRLGHVDLDALARLPPGSLGKTFVTFLRTQGIDPKDLPTREASSDSDWLQAHLYETHDIWHVVTGFGTDIASELGLQAFYQAQVPPLPFAAMLISGGLLNASIKEGHQAAARVGAVARGWRMGEEAAPLLGFDWAAHWSTPLAELRERLRITPAS